MKINLLKYIVVVCAVLSVTSRSEAKGMDSIPGPFSGKLQWRVGVDVIPAGVLAVTPFFGGGNEQDKRIRAVVMESVKADFSFNKDSKYGMLNHGLYQGIGVGHFDFIEGGVLGSPTGVYIYQGAPIHRIGPRLSIDYEWRFGAMFGWRPHYHYTAPVSTRVTALMSVGFMLNYKISSHWNAVGGISLTHCSNGNTSFPNCGVNSIGLSLGIAYVFNPIESYKQAPADMLEEANRKKWFYDIIAYGAGRKRLTHATPYEQVVPGTFAVIGLQFAPMRKLSRRWAVGGSLDLQYDRSAGLDPYWVPGTEHDDMQFRKVPFGKQLSIGVSGHGEFQMPIFSVDVGVGFALLNPKGNPWFYQSLTLKTFITKNVYLNVGYRLSAFSSPENLMLGVGVRL